MYAHRLQIYDTMHTAVKNGKDLAITRVMKRFYQIEYDYLTFWDI